MKYPYGGRWVTITAENLERFLLANVGRPVNKVYSEFLKRCDSTVQDPKYEFFREFEKKEDISPRWGGFYITNGIINYKRRKKPTSRTTISYSEINRQNMPSRSKLLEVCEKARHSRESTFLGRFYVCNRRNSHECSLVSVFVIPKDTFIWPSRRVIVPGIGVGISLYKETWGYKTRTKADFIEWESDFNRDPNAYEFIVKEK